ncbi:hypothetical protein NM208_g4537 [Fusarium decemcellulare]|uniref:Uncharacterized protein n=1 Tax=Fusarium decemcellulare TaxID=57161 RepID=A0ACC1SKB3_9HYPO|nr:hypothetical protein NM208_g4537 [Fusarium decemcellulare]
MAPSWLLLLSGVIASCSAAPSAKTFRLDVPKSLSGASIEHSPSFSSFSIEPAFFVEFVGTAGKPNELVFKLLSHLTDRGSQPIIRPGGIAMDSMIFDPNGGDLERTMGPNGEVYRTTVGPAYYESWSNFPDGVSFISTLNFGNNSLDIARDLAVASAKYQGARVKYFELGNEPNHFPRSRWNYETEKYVAQWKNWTAAIDDAVAEVAEGFGPERWWASSATTDITNLNVRPVDLIPAGIDSEDQVGQFSLHSYVYNSCSPSDAAKATIENLLNHTQITTFADQQVVPSAEAARKHGKEWVMGEFNSIACSGKLNVSDTFTQALWLIDTQLTYAVLNASSVNLHQGATLVLQSGSQINTPGFSTYDFVYPLDSEKHGEARSLPSFTGLLFLAEIFAQPKTRILPLQAPNGVNPDHFSGYATYQGNKLTKLILLNMRPHYTTSEDDFTINLDISSYIKHKHSPTHLKRLTTSSVDEKDASRVNWAGQSFKNGDAKGHVKTEQVSKAGKVKIKGSEAVMVFLNDDSIYGM